MLKLSLIPSLIFNSSQCLCPVKQTLLAIQSFPELLFQRIYQDRILLSWLLSPARVHTCLKLRQNHHFLLCSYQIKCPSLLWLGGFIHIAGEQFNFWQWDYSRIHKNSVHMVKEWKNVLQIWIMSEADPSP